MHIPKREKERKCIFFMDNKKSREFSKKSNEDFEKRVNRSLEEKYEVGEDSTKYGEFISSYFAWISLPNQKERAEELDNMTKGENDKNKRKNEK